jgi:hypothetical protein
MKSCCFKDLEIHQCYCRRVFESLYYGIHMKGIPQNCQKLFDGTSKKYPLVQQLLLTYNMDISSFLKLFSTALTAFDKNQQGLKAYSQRQFQNDFFTMNGNIKKKHSITLLIL